MSLVGELPTDTQSEVQAAAQAAGIDMATFVRQSVEACLHQTQPNSSLTEAQLLARINEGFPAGFWSRYQTLIAHRQARTLSPAQQKEMLALTDAVEAQSAERLEWLTQLARMQSKSVPELRRELQLAPIGVE